MNLKGQLSRFIWEESGQSTTEYILILSVVVMIALRFKNVFGQKMGEIVGNLTDGINGQIQNSLNGQ